MSDLVSILIPVYNAEEWLPETLRCAVNQTWANKEIIVVDDGSTDNSLAIARLFEGADVKVITQENQGGCTARNRAFDHAEGDFIQYLDADDLMDEDKIEVQMKRLADEPMGAVAACKWDRFYDVSSGVSLQDLGEVTFRDREYYRDYDEGMAWALKAASNEAMFPSHAWLVPRRLVEGVGRWDESLLINQDGEFFNRVVLASEGIAFCGDARVYYRSGIEDSVSQQRTVADLNSKYHAVELITSQILARETSRRTQRACAIAFQAFAYEAYPDVPDKVSQAREHVEELAGSLDFSPGGSGLYQHLHQWLGWKAAKRLRRMYYRLRYKQTI